MMEGPLDHWEQQLRATASVFTYPPTPDLAQRVTRRLQGRLQLHYQRRRAPRLAWAAAAVLVIFAFLMAVPSVRAQIVEFLQVGIVRIFLVEPSPTPAKVSPAVTEGAEEPEITPSTIPSSSPTPVPQSRFPGLFGETTLEEASRQVSYPIRLPQYPPDLGRPDRVYLQDLDGQVLVLVWFHPDEPGDVRMSLHTYAGESITAEKFQPRLVQETEVHGEPAVWAEGPYVLKLSNGSFQHLRLIEGHVLIWESEGVTYRLETDLSLEEAVRVAESLEPFETSSP